MKKICFVIPRAYSLFNPKIKGSSLATGGSQKQTYLLSTEIAKMNEFKVYFCVADFGQAPTEIIENVVLIKSFQLTQNKIFSLFKLCGIIRKINADAYIFRSANIGVAIMTMFIKLFSRKKVIYMLASEAETNFRDLRKMLGFYTALSMPIVFKQADIVTAQTESQMELLHKLHGRKPDAIIPNMIPLLKKSIDYQIKSIVLWIGRFVEHKNPGLFIELVNRFPDEQFIMIAPLVHESEKHMKIMHEKAKHLKNLILIDYVEPNEIEKYYINAKMYVLTSQSEGFSNTMTEAMAAGCAVLSYKVNNDGIFEKHQIGLFSMGLREKFFSDFELLCKDFELRRLLGINGMNYIKNHHQSQRIVQKFIELI